jgi:hypothetical protein
MQAIEQPTRGLCGIQRFDQAISKWTTHVLRWIGPSNQVLMWSEDEPHLGRWDLQLEQSSLTYFCCIPNY